MASRETQVPPVGEEVHLPGPSALPIVMAFGVTLAICGLTLSWIMVGAGVIIFLITTVRWVRDTRRDIDELPLEHEH